MNNILMSAPIFQQTQRVRFIGGEGIVRDFKPESGDWSYDIEMASGPEPTFGRVGAETMIVLNEAELCAA